MEKYVILIVEDEIIVANDIRNSLEKLLKDVDIFISLTGESAIQTAEKTLPDIVLMDIHLYGKMDGIETAEILRNRFNLPVLYLTSHADKNTLKRAKKTEPFGYLLKPFNEQTLSASIEMAIFKHQMENKLKQSEEKY